MLERVWRKGNPPTLLVEMQVHAASTSMKAPQKTENKVTNDPAIPLLAIYLDKVIIQKDTCIPIFTVALLTIVKKWKQPKCPSTQGWIKKIVCVCVCVCVCSCLVTWLCRLFYDPMDCSSPGFTVH